MTKKPIRVIDMDTIRSSKVPPRAQEPGGGKRGMTDAEADALEPGIYRVYYTSGATDLAAIGRRPAINQGERYRPPATWIAPVHGRGSATADGCMPNHWYWDMVERVERIEI